MGLLSQFEDRVRCTSPSPTSTSSTAGRTASWPTTTPSTSTNTVRSGSCRDVTSSSACARISGSIGDREAAATVRGWPAPRAGCPEQLPLTGVAARTAAAPPGAASAGVRTGLPSPPSARDDLRRVRHRRGVEDVADAEVDAERRADPADQPHRRHRVAAEVEEVVVDADRGQAAGSRRTASASSLLLRGVRGAPSPVSADQSGAGSALRSSFAVGGQRQRAVEQRRPASGPCSRAAARRRARAPRPGRSPAPASATT